MLTRFLKPLVAIAILMVSALLGWLARQAHHPSGVILHEIAWMGTRNDPYQQWIELAHTGRQPLDLKGWTLSSPNGNLQAALKGFLYPGDVLFLKREGSQPLPGVRVDGSFQGHLCASGTQLNLRDHRRRLGDSVDAWHAGDAELFATMQRRFPYRKGTRPKSWRTSQTRYDLGRGTPGFRAAPKQTREQLHYVYHAPGTINVYFNHHALTDLALYDNETNHQINLERRLTDRLRRASHRIDVAAYEINLPSLVATLMNKAAEGVIVRVLVDAKAPVDPMRVDRYRTMRLLLERLRRGVDGKIGTDDDSVLFANAPIFAVEDAHLRRMAGLPLCMRDLERSTTHARSREHQGFLLVDGERREDQTTFHPGTQMHNKFVIVDDQWVFTGSMNFTTTCIYGDIERQRRGLAGGNANHAIEINDPEIAIYYRDEFERMWGGEQHQPNPHQAVFSRRKAPRAEPHRVNVGTVPVDLYFSPGYDIIPAIVRTVDDVAFEAIEFSIFAWSDYALEQVVKKKWENDDRHRQGQRTGLALRGVFEFWDEWWSASINMTGRTSGVSSDQHPNIQWKHRPPVYRARGVRKLHHKYMILDAEHPKRATVITGSANWSANANNVNDENLLILRSATLANQFRQEFYARYLQSGGTIPETGLCIPDND